MDVAGEKGEHAGISLEISKLNSLHPVVSANNSITRFSKTQTANNNSEKG
jgi:hypothetical protein